MSNINIIFFSNKCEGSKLLISLMEKEKLDKYFHFICIDKAKSIPAQITATPTLIIRGVPVPYVANEAFIWLARIKQWKNNMLLQKVSTAQQQYLNNNLLPNNQNNILGFSQSEMQGMSDLFAYIQEDISIPHTYFSCDTLGKENIITPPLEDGQYNTSLNKNKLNSVKTKELSKKLEMERKKQDETFKSNIDNFIKQYK